MHYFSKTKRQGGCLKIRQGYYVYANDNEQHFGRFRCKAKTTEAEASGGANFEDGSRHRLQTRTVHSCVQMHRNDRQRVSVRLTVFRQNDF